MSRDRRSSANVRTRGYTSAGHADTASFDAVTGSFFEVSKRDVALSEGAAHGIFEVQFQTARRTLPMKYLPIEYTSR